MSRTPLDRRAFLERAGWSLTVAGVAAATTPRWLVERFGEAPEPRGCLRPKRFAPPLSDEPAPPPPAPVPAPPTSPACEAPARDLADALGHAARDERPLLVLVVPDDETVRYTAGGVFGAWLTHADDAEMALLAHIEVACASLAELRAARVKNLPRRDPTLLWIQPGARRVRARVSIDLSQRPARRRRGQRPPKGLTADELLSLRLAALRKELRELARLHPRSRAALRLPPGEERDELARRARCRLLENPVTRHPWGTSSGCGSRIDGDPPVGIACGMGRVPAQGRRFLALWAKR